MSGPPGPPIAAVSRLRGWVAGAAQWPRRFARVLRAGLPRSPWELAFDVLVLAFVTLMSGLSAVRYWTFQTRGWDLGVYLQSYTSIAHGAALPLQPHFTPFAWLIAPLLLAFPGGTTLLVVQAAALGGSGFAVFWLVRSATGRADLACLLGAAYLFGVMPISIGWFDYHTEALLPLFFLAALYARQRSNRTGFVAATLLALSVEEFSVVLVVGMAVGFALSSYLSRRSSSSDRTRDRSLAGVAAVLAIGWTLGTVLIAGLAAKLTQSSSALFAGSSGPGGLGAPTLAALPYVLSSDIGGWVTNLPFDASGKLLYLLLLFGAFGFLSFAGDLAELLPAGIWFAFALGSSASSLYAFGDQYVAYALPFVAASACSGAGRISRYLERRVAAPAPERASVGAPVRASRRHRSWELPVSAFVVGMIAVSGVTYPLLSQPLQGAPAVTFGFPEPTAHQQVLRDIIALIPPDARVLTTNDLFSQVATDPNALLSPISPVTVYGTTVAKYVSEEVAVASYVLLDFTMDWTNAAIVQLYGNFSGFHVVAAGDGIRLLARGPATAPPMWFGPETYTFGASDFVPELARLNSSSNGGVLVYQGTERTAGFFWTGPYFPLLAPGDYVVSAQFGITLPEPTTAFELKALQDGFTVDSTTVPVGGGYVSVQYAFEGNSSNQTVLADTYVNGSAGTHSYTVTIPFVWSSIGAFELVGLNPSIAQTVTFSGMTLVDTQPLP